MYQNEIYLDNVATTQLDAEVLETMLPYMTHFCGNPSSVYRYGCQAKVSVERARKQIANLFHITPAELVFTSGGTEGNNMLLRGIIEAISITHVLTSPLEHPSVRMPLEKLVGKGAICLDYLSIDPKGRVCPAEVEKWVKAHPRALVSLMQVNHEVGNITDIKTIGHICQQYGCFLHSDMVQSIYCMEADFTPLHLAVGSAHKIHGPKGIGFAYINANVSVEPLLYGGNQELNRRGGTENVAYIVGLAKAVEIAYRDRRKILDHLVSIKKYMIELLQERLPGVVFHGHSVSLTESVPSLLSISLPNWEDNDMLIYNLSIHGIAAAAGSACSSGSQQPSPVISLLNQRSIHAIRFSFSKHTTHAEIEEAVEALAMITKSL